MVVVKKMIPVFIVLSLFAVFASLALSQEDKVDISRIDVKTRERLSKLFSNVDFGDVKESPIKGVYEIAAGNNVIYFTLDGYMLFGEIWNKDGINLTAKRKEEIMEAKIKNLPLDKAIKIGNGKNVVVEFVDPDCPYCRKIYDYLSGRKDVTEYVFMYPLEQIHPKAKKKSEYALCSKDKEKAYKEVMTGKLDEKDVNMPECGVLTEHLAIGRNIGIRGTPTLMVNGKPVNGADIKRLENLLKTEEVKGK